jgi:predicted nucleic acid-binding protein
MIVLDTNVISEPLKPRPDERVVAWLVAQKPGALYLTATSLSELLVGIELLPAGKRKRAMMTAVQQTLDRLFAGRFLSFDREAAVTSSLLASRASSRGFTISVGDCQIAAIAAVHGFAVATRDTAPFLAAGVPVINPWKS